MPRLVPANFHDPIGLAMRILRSRDPAALFAVASTLLAAIASPLDALLERVERRLYAQASSPRLPIVLVVGAPRSGTTLVSQVLAAQLPVSYFNNLTAVFPRAPITANRVFGRFLHRATPDYQSFYGRTSGLAAQNDALYLWDRWLGNDRYSVPRRLDAPTMERMRKFFAAYERAFEKPILTKNNALATAVTPIAEALPTAHFVVVRRDPVYAVRSILRAREVIQGSPAAPYGVAAPRAVRKAGTSMTPVEEVCAQVLYHERRLREQRAELGARLTVVDYEEFCRDAVAVVVHVGRDVLAVDVDPDAVRVSLPRLRSTNGATGATAEHEEIRATLARLDTEPVADVPSRTRVSVAAAS